MTAMMAPPTEPSGYPNIPGEWEYIQMSENTVKEENCAVVLLMVDEPTIDIVWLLFVWFLQKIWSRMHK